MQLERGACMHPSIQPRQILRALRAVNPRLGRLGATTVVSVGLAGLLLGAAAGPSLGASRPTVYYLAPAGNDAAAGSLRRPWRTLYASLRKLRPGDTLYVRGGAYRFGGVNSTTLAGTATRPIVIAAYRGESPVFTGTTTPADFLYFSGNSAWITLRGLTVQGGGATSDSSGSSLLGFVGNANHIRIDHVRLFGSAGWSANQHLAYVAGGSVHDITFTGDTFDGRGCRCAGLLQFYHDPNAARVAVVGSTFRRADQAVLVWANVSGLRMVANTFSYVRIAVRYHHSAGTAVTGNRGSHVAIGIYADSSTNLAVSGNSW
jgi:hypothetical protein